MLDKNLHKILQVHEIDPIKLNEFGMICMNRWPKMLEKLFYNAIPHFKATELGSKLGTSSFINFNFLKIMSKSSSTGLG